MSQQTGTFRHSPILSAFGLTFYQFALVLAVTGGRLSQLVNWDAQWYRDIAVYGYQVSFPLTRTAGGGSNIAFFPAFPLWVRGFYNIFRLSPDLSVTLAAQLACVGLWAYFLLLLKRLRVENTLTWVAVGMLLLQPGSFYNVVGYSESLFTAALLGFIYWSGRAVEESKHKPLHLFLAIAHGAVLSSTRILGVALVSFPLLLAATRSLQRKKLERGSLGLAVMMGSLSLGGFFGFLIYCQLRWGKWDLYWEANRVGWGVYFDPFKIFHASYYSEVFFAGNLSEVLGRLLTVGTLGLLSGLGVWTWRKRSADPFLLALGLLSFGLLAETVIGSHGMHSMIRYLIPIHALVIPLAVARSRISVRWAAVGLFLFAMQILFVIRYSRVEWVS